MPLSPLHSLPSSVHPGLKQLSAEEVLLALIAGLLGARLVGLLLPAFFVGPDGTLAEGEPRLFLVCLLLGLQAFCLIGAVWWVTIWRNGLSWAALGLVPLPRGWGLRSAGAALVAFLLAGAVNLAIQASMEAPQRNPQIDVIAPAGFSWPALIAILALAAVLVPIAEEIFFRGLIHGWLRRRLSVGWATAASALLFALLHDIPYLIPAIFLLGIILAQVYERSGSIWAASLTHGIFNGITTLIFYFALAQGIEL